MNVLGIDFTFFAVKGIHHEHQKQTHPKIHIYTDYGESPFNVPEHNVQIWEKQ